MLTKNVDITINKATPSTGLSISSSVLYNAANQMVNIADQVSSYKRTGDTLTYAVGAVSGTSPGIIQTKSVDTEGMLTFTVSGLVGNTATIPVMVGGFGNYNDITVNVVVTLIAKKTVTIDGITTLNKTYDGTAYMPSGTASVNGGSVPVSELVWKYESTDSGSYNSSSAPTNAGAYKLTISVPDSNANYIGSEAFTFIIEKRQITLAADNKSVIKGDTLPDLTYTVGNLSPGKTKTDALSAEPILACPTFNGNTVGSYPIMLTGGATTDNYTIAIRTNGTLSVAEQYYTITFNPNGGTRTGGGDLTQTIAKGSAATAPILSRGNYTLMGWDKSFVNVTANLTVTANWRYDGGGGSGGGGGDYTPTPIIPIVTEKQSDRLTVAKSSVSGTVKDGTLSASITEQMVKDGIKVAQDAAKKSGKELDGIALDFNVTDTGSYANLNATIEAGAIDHLKESGVKFIKIGSSVLDVTLDWSAITEMDKQSTGMITVLGKKITKLSAAAKKLIGNRPVFDITVSYQKNGKTEYVSSFGKGVVTLSIAYKATGKENKGNLFGVYVDKNGKPQLLTNSSYDNTGRLTLSRNSLSTYGVGYKVPAPQFTDTAKHWAKDNIDFVASHDLISGTSATTFAPNTAITRADFLMALGRLSGVDVGIYKTSSFTDVKSTDIAMPYIEWAVKNKIVSGYGNGNFRPTDSITREQMAVMMVNYAKATGYKLPVSKQATTFADDAKISAYATDAVKAIQQTGVINGKDNNRFDPQGNATRGEASTILRSFVELVIDEGTARGWIQNDAGQWQWIGENGKPAVGWLSDENGKYHYYFTTDGIMVFGKWLQIDGKWYYFYTDGSLAQNTKVDGHEVDENGVRKIK